MELKKKVISLMLTFIILLGSGFMFEKSDAYVRTGYIKRIYSGHTYYYNLDGDRDRDSIRQYVSHGNVYLKVNGVVKKIISNYDSDYMSYNVKIYNFNRHDRSLEIVVSLQGYDEYHMTRIIKFQDKRCRLDRIYDLASISSYENSNGMITFRGGTWCRYKYFINSIGCFNCYPKTRINGYNAYNQYTAYTDSHVRKNSYKAARTLTAYTSTSATRRDYTVRTGEIVHVYGLYQKGSRRFVKIKNKYGDYGYVRASSYLLFEDSSCLWWQ